MTRFCDECLARHSARVCRIKSERRNSLVIDLACSLSLQRAKRREEIGSFYSVAETACRPFIQSYAYERRCISCLIRLKLSCVLLLLLKFTTTNEMIGHPCDYASQKSVLVIAFVINAILSPIRHNDFLRNSKK